MIVAVKDDANLDILLTDYDVIYFQELLDCMRRAKVAHHLVRSLERKIGVASIFDLMCLWFLSSSDSEKNHYITELLDECQYLGN